MGKEAEHHNKRSASKSELAEFSRWWRRSISYLFLYLSCEGRGNIIQKLYFCRYYLQQWKCFILNLNDGVRNKRERERVHAVISSVWLWHSALRQSYINSSVWRAHLFVGGHDPLDGVGSWGQEVAGRGESLCPLAHHHVRLPVCCF